MRDVGFTPRRSASVAKEVRGILKSSLVHGFHNPPVRWLMLAAPFTGGVGFFAFYAMQPFLLELYGRHDSYAIAGLAAAVVAGTQIAGGLLVPWLQKAFRLRTSMLIFGVLASAAALALIGMVSSFWIALTLFGGWAMVFAATGPVRQAYINDLIPSAQRATVLSSDSLLGSSGGVLIQPLLGRAADMWGYSIAYVVSAGIELLALPFVLLARREKASSE